VVIRENGKTTYFASDIAYHNDKRKRGHDHLLDILGSDHHGYQARVRAGLEAMGYGGDSLEVELMQFVSLYRAGEKQAMSTRSGEFVTLRQLREERDAGPGGAARRGGDPHRARGQARRHRIRRIGYQPRPDPGGPRRSGVQPGLAVSAEEIGTPA
ncbi:MAG: arginine--tRNA ligase, partial [Chloroflexi bacterium]|nr:arginine--tRNA ligase [Chloroflexota bacterium]